jgi:hypothetical protein
MWRVLLLIHKLELTVTATQFYFFPLALFRLRACQATNRIRGFDIPTDVESFVSMDLRLTLYVTLKGISESVLCPHRQR